MGEECRRSRRGAPAADLANKFPEKIVPLQIPFNLLRHYRNRGMPVRRGREPPRARSLRKIPAAQHGSRRKNAKSENPGDASLAGTLPITNGKNPSKPPYPTIRIPLFPSYEDDGSGSRVFSRKNRVNFPRSGTPFIFRP
jgi:hypothetical protein